MNKNIKSTTSEMKEKYKKYLVIFYGIVFLISIRDVFIKIFEFNSSLDEIAFSWTFGMSLILFFMLLVGGFSILVIILVLQKKIPKFNLIFPIYYLVLLFLWGVIKPKIISLISNSIDEYIQFTLSVGKYWAIFSIINLIFSSFYLWKILFNKNIGGKKK